MVLERQILANKYARAFFDLNSAKLTVRDIDNIFKIASFLDQNRNILVYIQLGLIDHESAKEIFKDLFSKFGLPGELNSLVKLLINDSRINLFSCVLSCLANLFFQENNILEATLESSHELDKTQVQTFVDFFSEKTGKKIRLKQQINKNLIAGVKLYSSTKAWQQNVKNQIKSIDA